MLNSNRKIKVLIVDDDEDDYFIIAGYIKDIEGSEFQTDWCNNYETAWEQIRQNTHDVYFVDYSLGNETGLDLLRRSDRIGCAGPIILLTGKGNRAIDIEAMKNGATDYLIKSELNTEKIERCIRYSLDRAASLKVIKESENKYRSLFSGSKDALFIADKNLLFKEVNQSAAILLGYSTLTLQGTNLYDFIDNSYQTEKIKQTLENGRNIYDYEIEIMNANEEKKVCLLSVLHENTSPEPSVLHGIIHDISNIKKAELANLQKEKLAANERLIRVLAHEIRNPLNNIKLSADQLQMLNEATDEKQKSIIGIIQRNSLRINQLITELINSTKTIELIFAQHTLQEIIEEAILNAIDRINLQKVNLSKSLPTDPLYVLADKSKLQLGFSNILINAIESMDAGNGELFVGIKETGDIYSVSIKDNGKGIPREQMSRLFEPFFTLKKNGMGLGLSTALSIFQSHNASIHVESHESKGTTFIIDFEKARQHTVINKNITINTAT